MTKIVDLQPRLSSRPRGMKVVAYTSAAVHEGVCVAQLVTALTRHGLTLSNVEGHGLVIHRIGQDPSRPAPLPPAAS